MSVVACPWHQSPLVYWVLNGPVICTNVSGCKNLTDPLSVIQRQQMDPVSVCLVVRWGSTICNKHWLQNQISMAVNIYEGSFREVMFVSFCASYLILLDPIVPLVLSSCSPPYFPSFKLWLHVPKLISLSLSPFIILAPYSEISIVPPPLYG